MIKIFIWLLGLGILLLTALSVQAQVPRETPFYDDPDVTTRGGFGTPSPHPQSGFGNAPPPSGSPAQRRFVDRITEPFRNVFRTPRVQVEEPVRSPVPMVNVEPDRTPAAVADTLSCSLDVINDTDDPMFVEFDIVSNDARRYRITFGDGTDAENTSGNFSHRYTQEGTYTVRGYVRSNDRTSWQGGEDSCRIEVFVDRDEDVLIDEQPETGPETVLTMGLGLSGMVGWGLLHFGKR